MPFWRLLTCYKYIEKNIDQTTFVRLLFLNLKQKKNMKKYFLRFLFQNSQTHFFGGQLILFLNFVFSVLALKTVDTQMVFWSIFFKLHFKKLLTAKNGQNGIFDGL